MSILHERVHLDTTDHDDSRVPFTHFKVNSFARSRSSLLFDTARRPFALARASMNVIVLPGSHTNADEGV